MSSVVLGAEATGSGSGSNSRFLVHLFITPSRLVIARACNQSLRPATKILSQCGVVITVDTVWMHVANALNIPTLCIGGNRGVFDLGYYGPVGNGSMTVFGHKLANSLSISGAYPTVENWVKSHV